MSLFSFGLKQFLSAKLGADGADAVIDTVRTVYGAPHAGIDPASVRSTLAVFADATHCVQNGFLPLKLPDKAAGIRGLAILLKPSLRNNQPFMDELNQHGDWDLYDAT